MPTARRRRRRGGWYWTDHSRPADLVDLRGTAGGPDLAAAESTISQIQNALGVVTSMKRNCTEANKNIDNVRASIEQLEREIRDKIRELRQSLGL